MRLEDDFGRTGAGIEGLTARLVRIGTWRRSRKSEIERSETTPGVRTEGCERRTGSTEVIASESAGTGLPRPGAPDTR